MTDWLPSAIKEGGFFAIAILSMVVALGIFREYLKLVSLMVEMVRSSTAADTNLIGTINRLVAVVEARNASERK